MEEDFLSHKQSNNVNQTFKNTELENIKKYLENQKKELSKINNNLETINNSVQMLINNLSKKEDILKALNSKIF